MRLVPPRVARARLDLHHHHRTTRRHRHCQDRRQAWAVPLSVALFGLAPRTRKGTGGYLQSNNNNNHNKVRHNHNIHLRTKTLIQQRTTGSLGDLIIRIQ